MNRRQWKKCFVKAKSKKDLMGALCECAPRKPKMHSHRFFSHHETSSTHGVSDVRCLDCEECRGYRPVADSDPRNRLCKGFKIEQKAAQEV